MKIKTADLIDLALDWAVAKCLQPGYEEWRLIRWIEQEFAPTANWSKGGPIIEREGISLLYLYVTDDPFRWAATQKPTIKKVKPKSVYGPTPLIAAMRCVVAANIGDEVDVPEELL